MPDLKNWLEISNSIYAIYLPASDTTVEI